MSYQFTDNIWDMGLPATFAAVFIGWQVIPNSLMNTNMHAPSVVLAQILEQLFSRRFSMNISASGCDHRDICFVSSCWGDLNLDPIYVMITVKTLTQEQNQSHRINPPFFIQARLQQYRRRSSLYSAHCSFCSPIHLRSMRCWKSLLPWWIFKRFVKFQWIVIVNDFRLFWRLEKFSETLFRFLRIYSHPSLRTLWSAVIKSSNWTCLPEALLRQLRLLQRALVILVRKHTSQFRSFLGSEHKYCASWVPLL